MKQPKIKLRQSQWRSRGLTAVAAATVSGERQLEVVVAAAAALVGQRRQRVEGGGGGGRIGAAAMQLFNKAQPYLTGEVTPICKTMAFAKMTEVNSKVLKLKEVIHSLNSLEIKLKAPRESLLQTQITNSLNWAEKQITLDCIRDFVPSIAESVSFAAHQPVSGSSPSELAKLLREVHGDGYNNYTRETGDSY